jgi:hypothetical protein
MTSASEEAGSRVSTLLVVLASVGALAVIGALAWAMTRPSPVREVSFDVVSELEPTCEGPAYWTGREAFTACDWAYPSGGLIRFDPMHARAVVVHHWEMVDRDLPELQIAVACSTGHLFVVRERGRTTVIRVDDRGPPEVVTLSDATEGLVLGASCRTDVAELFVVARETTGHSILRIEGERILGASVVGADDVVGAVMGAWHEDGRWHVVVAHRTSSREPVVAAGPLGGPFKPLAGADEYRSCLFGAPGGWLERCRGGQSLITQRDGELAVEPLLGRELAVIYADRNTLGTTTDEKHLERFGGLPSGDLELIEVDGELVARSSTTSSTRGSSEAAPLHLRAVALPLADGSVAIWGALGQKVVRLGPDLEREDALDPNERILRPYGRFRASTMSTVDQIAWFTLLGFTPFLIVIVIASRGRRRTISRPLRDRVSASYLVVLMLCANGFLEIIDWI